MIFSTVLTSASVVALAEVGDKTMLLAILLVSRMRKPWAILAGILCATIVNHSLAAFVGSEVSGLLDAKWFRILIAVSFIAMAAWTLVPDRIDKDDVAAVRSHGGAFLTTVIAFFFVEIGDKTQIATIALAAHYHSVIDVAVGTTLGMMIADGAAVFLGEALVRRISLRGARIIAAVLFLVLGLWQLAAVLSGD
jgi:putative Ca2+/H+ antiporter (TMEM165/GDT1 family)